MVHTKTSHFLEWQMFEETDPFVEGGELVADRFFGTNEPKKIPHRKAYCRNVELCIKPSFRGEFMKVIENYSKGCNNDEPLCLQHDYVHIFKFGKNLRVKS